MTNDKADLWIPDLGMVVLTIYPGARAKGLRPVVVEPILYPHPLRDVKDLWEEMDGKKSDN
jgi:hypothetical protein